MKKIFLDVGGHIGETLKVALDPKYNFDKVFCFEPVPQYWQILKTFNDNRLTICEYGLWNDNCTKQIFGPNTMGASLFKDKFKSEVESIDIQLKKASDWFAQNLSVDDQVYLKLNCEGAECAILENLIATGEYKKIKVLMVDFDVRKIPSQKSQMGSVKLKLHGLGIPKIYYIDENPRGKLTHTDFTRYWLDNPGSSYSNMANIMTTLGYITNKFKLDLSQNSPIEILGVGREHLAQWLHDLDFKTGVEVGVAFGEYSLIICQKNPQMKVYGVDPFLRYKGYKDYVKDETFNKLYLQAKKSLKGFPKYIFLKEFSLDALKRFPDNSLDFVYIDANHEDPYITQDLEGWYPKIKSGGIMAGHDYIRAHHTRCDVISALNNFTIKHKINPWFLIGSSAKTPEVYRDGTRSWMIVKS